MKLLITGGAGYLGANLIKKLLSNNKIDDIICYDNFFRKNYNVLSLLHSKHSHKLRFLQSDILDGKSLKRALSGCDVVVHLAAITKTAFNDDSPHVYDQTNHWGTANLVSQIEATDSVSRVIYSSSGAVYGFGQDIHSAENPVNPVTSYANSKYFGEEHIRRLSSSRKVSVVRFANIFGIGMCMRFDSVFNHFFLDQILGNKLLINGSGEQYRPFIYLKEAIATLQALLFSDHAPELIDANSQNWRINDLVDGLKTINPALESIKINQNEQLRDLLIRPQLYTEHGLTRSALDLQQYIQDMQSDFSEAKCDL